MDDRRKKLKANDGAADEVESGEDMFAKAGIAAE